jgi:hypothetical protein
MLIYFEQNRFLIEPEEWRYRIGSPGLFGRIASSRSTGVQPVTGEGPSP